MVKLKLWFNDVLTSWIKILVALRLLFTKVHPTTSRLGVVTQPEVALPNGAIHIGTAIVTPIIQDVTGLYFDTGGDVGFRGVTKFNQGHWARTLHGAFSSTASNDDIANPLTQTARNAVYKAFVDDSRLGATSGATNLKGFVRFFNWRQLEEGATEAAAVYDFSQVAGDLVYLTSIGQRLMICVETRIYDNSGLTAPPAPAYIQNHVDTTGGQSVKASYRHETGGANGLGWSTRIYHAYVRDRFKVLLTALATATVTGDTGGPGGTARTFDNHPNFEGIYFQETAIGIDTADVLTPINPLANPGLNNDRAYWQDGVVGSTSVLADMWGSINGTVSVVSGATAILTYDGYLIHAVNVFPSSRIFWTMNFLAGQEGSKTRIASRFAPYGIVMGGPDCAPDEAAFSNTLTSEYIVMNAHRDVDPLPTDITMSVGKSYAQAHTNRVPYVAADFPNSAGWTSTTTRNWTLDEIYFFAIRNPAGNAKTDYDARPGLGCKYIFWHTTGQWTGAGTDTACQVIHDNPTFN